MCGRVPGNSQQLRDRDELEGRRGKTHLSPLGGFIYRDSLAFSSPALLIFLPSLPGLVTPEPLLRKQGHLPLQVHKSWIRPAGNVSSTALEDSLDLHEPSHPHLLCTQQHKQPCRKSPGTQQPREPGLATDSCEDRSWLAE